MALRIFNTLSRKKENFEPLNGKNVGLYTCGPTVYNYAHIGNLRTYVFEDILRRVLKYNNYKVNHVMNITDVGHLTDDADRGEDKIEKESKKEGKSAKEIAEFYTQAFKENMRDLNILEPHIWCKATEHIQEQIDHIKILIEKGYTYKTSDGIYFDTTKLDDYGKLAMLDKQNLKAGERVSMKEKKNPHDFALWKFSNKDERRQMKWEAFGRKGFPGWHIECSAMGIKYLGEQFDIHCGGIDHIPVHHTNEIAQAEAITGKKPWVKYWMHGEFLIIDNSKMSKSEGNFITLQTLKDKSINPLSYRYFLLQTHYRKQLNFSWEAIKAAENGLNNLREHVKRVKEKTVTDPKLEEYFLSAINDDLNTPEALVLVWKALKTARVNLETIIKLDKVLGLKLHNPNAGKKEIPLKVRSLLDKRAKAKKEKNWQESDRLRAEIAELGYKIEDNGNVQNLIPGN